MTHPDAPHTLRLVGALGTNKVMLGELSRLGRRALSDVRIPEAKKDGEGQVTYPFVPQLAAVAASYHRTSARVLWDVCQSRARRLEPLFDDVKRQVASDSRGWLWHDASLSVQAFRVDEFAAGERQVVGAIKNALLEGAAERGIALRVDPSNPDVLLNVRMSSGAVRISVDLAGKPMHQRGYRLDAGDAPLREDVAAHLVMLTRFDARSETLVDPMAGSGTIAIEAACMAQALPCFVGREPTAFRLPEIAPHRGVLQGPLFADTRASICTLEIDEATFAASQTNAIRAGVTAAIDARHTDFRDVDPRSLAASLPPHHRGGVIVTNPPYGERVGEEHEVEALYRDLGKWCRELRGWRAGFIVANPKFERCFAHGRPRIKKPMKNGPLNASFLMYDL